MSEIVLPDPNPTRLELDGRAAELVAWIAANADRLNAIRFGGLEVTWQESQWTIVVNERVRREDRKAA